MEIGYIGYSKDLSHPADRRRIAIWNSIPGNRINTESPLEGEMLLLSNAANLGFWIKKSHKPVVLDLVEPEDLFPNNWTVQDSVWLD